MSDTSTKSFVNLVQTLELHEPPAPPKAQAEKPTSKILFRIPRMSPFITLILSDHVNLAVCTGLSSHLSREVQPRCHADPCGNEFRRGDCLRCAPRVTSETHCHLSHCFGKAFGSRKLSTHIEGAELTDDKPAFVVWDILTTSPGRRRIESGA